MERPKFRRKKYFIHASTQFKYIAMSILPALFVGVFCVFLSINSGLILSSWTKANTTTGIDDLELKLDAIIRDTVPRNADEIGKLVALRKEILSYRLAVGSDHYRFLQEWNATMALMVVGIMGVLICVAVLALLYSHRIAGPIARIKRCLDMLADKKDIPPPIRLRDYDEFKELADSLNKLLASNRIK